MSTVSALDVLADAAAAQLARGRTEDAAATAVDVLRRDPLHPVAVHTLGAVAWHLGRPRDAEVLFGRAVAASPDDAGLREAWAHALLLLGDFARGWAEYEFRPGGMRNPAAAHGTDAPAWDGRALGGETVLLRAEQGFGDALQFCRYAPLVAARGGRVVLECARPLAPLLAGLEGVGRVVVAGDPLPRVDTQAPLMSLPHLFGTTLATIPAEVPYLRADPRLAARWADRLRPDGAPRVGLVWAGNPRNVPGLHRSVPPRDLAPLAALGGVRWYALQTGQPPGAELPALPGLTDPGPGLRGFADTAGVLANLDLLVTVDTAAAHLAGGMGKPVWTLLPHVADWRWLLEREDSPWYPTMRLFRQTAPGDWTGVVGDVAAHLHGWAASHRR